MFALIYVDNITVASSSDQVVSVLLHQLGEHSARKDLGSLYYFLGIEVTRDSHGIVLTQAKYASDILALASI